MYLQHYQQDRATSRIFFAFQYQNSQNARDFFNVFGESSATTKYQRYFYKFQTDSINFIYEPQSGHSSVNDSYKYNQNFDSNSRLTCRKLNYLTVTTVLKY